MSRMVTSSMQKGSGVWGRGLLCRISSLSARRCLFPRVMPPGCNHLALAALSGVSVSAPLHRDHTSSVLAHELQTVLGFEPQAEKKKIYRAHIQTVRIVGVKNIIWESTEWGVYIVGSSKGNDVSKVLHIKAKMCPLTSEAVTGNSFCLFVNF